MIKFDIHTHILPGLDDGSDSEAESLQMIAKAYQQKIKTFIATPHYSGYFEPTEANQIRKMCKELERKARREIAPDISIYPGQEIFYCSDMVEKLEQGELLTLADSRFVLVEFLPSVPYSTMYQALRNIITARYRPILAHVERYDCLKVDDRIDAVLRAGVYLQMNYRHICGKWYDPIVRWSKQMLLQENIHFLATDMHHIAARGPETMDAENWMLRCLDSEYMQDIFSNNARRLLLHENIGVQK